MVSLKSTVSWLTHEITWAGVGAGFRVGVRVRVRVGVTVTVTVRVGQPPEAFAGCECREHDVTHAQPQRAWYVVVSTW